MDEFTMHGNGCCVQIADHQAAKQRIKELEAKLAALDWQPITESLPRRQRCG